jgi:hypothetical protein
MRIFVNTIQKQNRILRLYGNLGEKEHHGGGNSGVRDDFGFVKFINLSIII